MDGWLVHSGRYIECSGVVILSVVVVFVVVVVVVVVVVLWLEE